MVRIAPRFLLLAALAAAVAACSDRNPAGPRALPPEEAPPPTHAALLCRMDVRAETLACGPTDARTAPGVSPLIVGGQGSNVRLTSSGTRYDAGTGILRSEVTVQNLMAQALGTDDGAFPASQGVRVFFFSGPSVTQGTGEVTVANADGEDVFTAAAQKYFQYPGMLAQGETSAPREWRFGVPSTVEFFVFTVLVAAPVAGAEAPPPAILFLAGPDRADSIGAEPATRLRIGVRGPDGKPVENTPVYASAMSLPYPWFQAEVEVGSTEGSGFLYSATAYTDARGIAEFRVRMGPVAGTGRLVVQVPQLQLADTARYTILPGRATDVRIFPEDTVVLIGGRAPLRPAAFDRNGNARNEPIALSVAAGPGRAEGSEVVAGASIGRISAVATVGGVSDTAYVRVVPPGTVAAYSNPDNSGQTGAIYTFSLDGSDFRRVRTTVRGIGYNAEMAVDWLSPTKLVYHDHDRSHNEQLYVLDLETGAVARFLPLPEWMESESLPRTSQDGSWVYFSGGDFGGMQLYRARGDGSGKAVLSFEPSGFTHEWGAHPSPDGTRIVFVRGGVYGGGTLTIGELGTGAAVPLKLNGLWPRWSPDGTRIAFVATTDSYDWGAGPLAVVNADGTGARALTLTEITGDIDWSPDGRYIVGATGYNQLAVVEVATGAEVVVSLPVDGSIRSPVWKP